MSELSAEVRDVVFVVIPAYNEGSSLAAVLAEVSSLYPNTVVVDDGSSDDTYATARAAGVHTLRHIVNRGQGAALQTGIRYALARNAQYIVTFDADGQHCVEDIAALVEPIRAGEFEITLGSRFLGQSINMPASRRLLLRCAIVFTRIVSRVHLTDVHNGLRAFSRSAAESIEITMDRMAHASELIDLVHRSGKAYREVPVKVLYTAYSLAKGQSAKGAINIVIQYITGRILR